MKTIFLCISLLLSGSLYAQNNFKGPKVKAKVSTYNITSKSSNIIISNDQNKFRNQKPNRKIEDIPITGLDLKDYRKHINLALKASFRDKDLAFFNKMPNIFTELFILADGSISEVTFIVPENSNLIPNDIEVIENAIKKNKIKVKTPSLYDGINFVPIAFVIRANELL